MMIGTIINVILSFFIACFVISLGIVAIVVVGGLVVLIVATIVSIVGVFLQTVINALFAPFVWLERLALPRSYQPPPRLPPPLSRAQARAQEELRKHEAHMGRL
jgi:hypothetical protein